MSFKSDLGSFRLKTTVSADRIVRGLTIELFAGVVRDTPVDTGAARGNWQTTVESAAVSKIERLDRGGAEATSEIIAKTPPKAGQKTFLANNLPYIDELENGSSKQAPSGMVRKNFLRVQAILNQVIAKNRV